MGCLKLVVFLLQTMVLMFDGSRSGLGKRRLVYAFVASPQTCCACRSFASALLRGKDQHAYNALTWDGDALFASFSCTGRKQWM